MIAACLILVSLAIVGTVFVRALLAAQDEM